ncbi:hypothetical protein [Psychrobacter glaciei]|uniref:hypothetical protein n=1 Tax=Psychrobacter glaciei TaxID=619771 RepID=UPI001F070BFC|nr:hypothetical protein [Psychrobacter glaciei]MCH1783507.1 hypothetical protein [Psychrobacter glaciei]
MVTNEQKIVEIEQKMQSLKKDYMTEVESIIDNTDIDISMIRSCHESALNYFNYVEQFVGNSGLLGAHKNGKWVTGFAESCYAVLETVIQHFNFIESYKTNRYPDTLFKPSAFAFANMQRMVKEYIPTKAAVLKKDLVDSRLPVSGFESSASADKDWYFYFKEILGIVFGFIVVIGVSWFAIETPEPSTSQFFIMRALFALSLAAIGGLIPGFLSIKTNSKYIIIRATGAIAIFVIVWLINPPALI